MQLSTSKIINYLKENLEYRRIRNKLKNNRYTILKRYLDGKYTERIEDKNYIHVSPYVGVMFDVPRGVELKDKLEPVYEYQKLAKVLAGVATQTEEFVEHFSNPDDYLKYNSLTRGSQDAIIIEKRGFVACGVRREINQLKDKDSARKDFLKNPYATLVFSIEAVMATLKSVNAFNKELEEYIAPVITKMLRQIKLEYKEVKEIRMLVSKARSLSPCEDYSSNLDIHLRSKIAASGAKKMRNFALSDLVETVQHRLDNYGHFLKTAHEDILIRRAPYIRALTSMLLYIIISIVAFILTYFSMK